mgnify:FL=1
MKTSDNPLRKAFRAACRALDWVEMNFLILFTSFIGLYIILEIVLRIFHIQGARWIEEMGRMMLVTTTLVGSSVAVKTKGHMGMTALINILPGTFSNVLEIASNLICGGAFLFISYYALQWTMDLFTLKRTMESINFPIWPFWAIITFAYFTTGIRFLIQIRYNVQGIRRGVYQEADLKEM